MNVLFSKFLKMNMITSLLNFGSLEGESTQGFLKAQNPKLS